MDFVVVKPENESTQPGRTNPRAEQCLARNSAELSVTKDDKGWRRLCVKCTISLDVMYIWLMSTGIVPWLDNLIDLTTGSLLSSPISE